MPVWISKTRKLALQIRRVCKDSGSLELVHSLDDHTKSVLEQIQSLFVGFTLTELLLFWSRTCGSDTCTDTRVHRCNENTQTCQLHHHTWKDSQYAYQQPLACSFAGIDRMRQGMTHILIYNHHPMVHEKTLLGHPPPGPQPH